MTYWLIAAGAAMAQASSVTVAPPRPPTVAEARINRPVQTAPMAGNATTVAAIRELERKWGQAFVNRDFAFIERIVAPEFRLTGGSALGNPSVLSRVDWMRNARAFHHVAFADEVVDVMTAGDTAVALVKTLWTVQMYADRPAQERRGLCADTWLRRQGNWQVVYRNCGPMPDASPSPAAGPKATP